MKQAQVTKEVPCVCRLNFFIIFLFLSAAKPNHGTVDVVLVVVGGATLIFDFFQDLYKTKIVDNNNVTNCANYHTL